MTPLQIIDKWMEYAHANELYNGPDGSLRRQWFWVVRDLLQGLHVTQERVQEALEYLTDNCRPSGQREALVQALTALKGKS